MFDRKSAFTSSRGSAVGDLFGERAPLLSPNHRDKRWIGPAMIKCVLTACATLAMAAGVAAEERPTLSDIVRIGTSIKGNFKFTTGNQATGEWELTIRERSGRKFTASYKARWTPPNDGSEFVCDVEGKVEGNKLEFSTVNTDPVQATATVIEVADETVKLRWVGSEEHVAIMEAELPSEDPFAKGAVWTGDFKVIRKDMPVRKWLLTVTERKGTTFKGNVVVRNRDMEVEAYQVSGTATNKATGAIVCSTEKKGLAQVKLSGKLKDGETVLIFSGTNDLGQPGAGIATLKPRN